MVETAVFHKSDKVDTKTWGDKITNSPSLLLIKELNVLEEKQTPAEVIVGRQGREGLSLTEQSHGGETAKENDSNRQTGPWP